MLKQFPSLPFHSAEFFKRKIFNADKYEPNKHQIQTKLEYFAILRQVNKKQNKIEAT